MDQRNGPNPTAPGISDDDDQGAPRLEFSRRQIVAGALVALLALTLLYLVLPKLSGARDTWTRLKDGDPWWVAVAVLFELCSFLGYVALFRVVFVRGHRNLGWRASYEITMAGVAATRLLAAAGAGGIALTAWALRRSGMERRVVACRMFAFLIVLYAVFMSALVIDGVLLRTGAISGSAPLAFTVIPAVFGSIVIALVTAIMFLPADFDVRVEAFSRRHGSSRRLGRIAASMSTVPASLGSGGRTALALLRARHPGMLGALAWWGFDVATLWAAFHAFGSPPALGVIVMAYFVGQLGNVLPLPGGIGGVEGGMIGAFAAFGVDYGLSLVAVLTYRGLAFWLPTIPGAAAYFQLRRTVAGWRADESDNRTAIQSKVMSPERVS